MKKLFFACSLLVATIMYAPSIMAQSTPAPAAAPGGPRQQLTPDQRAEKQTEQMQKNLGLSDDQFTKVKQINLNFQTQIDKLRSNGSSNNDPQQMHTQMKALRDQRDADLKGVLTTDQYTKMQSMQHPQRPGAAPATPQQQN
jgi:periplasmic protein CpxP/Spy